MCCESQKNAKSDVRLISVIWYPGSPQLRSNKKLFMFAACPDTRNSEVLYGIASIACFFGLVNPTPNMIEIHLRGDYSKLWERWKDRLFFLDLLKIPGRKKQQPAHWKWWFTFKKVSQITLVTNPGLVTPLLMCLHSQQPSDPQSLFHHRAKWRLSITRTAWRGHDICLKQVIQMAMYIQGLIVYMYILSMTYIYIYIHHTYMYTYVYIYDCNKWMTILKNYTMLKGQCHHILAMDKGWLHFWKGQWCQMSTVLAPAYHDHHDSCHGSYIGPFLWPTGE